MVLPTKYLLGIGIPLTIYAFKTSRIVRFWIRVVVMIIAVATVSIYGILAAILLQPLGRAADANYHTGKFMAYVWGRILGIKIVVEGEGRDILEDSQRRPGAIFPRACAVLAKSSLKWYPLLGAYMMISKAVFINRKNRESAIDTMSRVADTMKREKIGIFLYPEGTRSHQKTNTMLPFKKGAFHVAISGQIPIVPVVISTTSHLYDSRKMLCEGGEIRVKVLASISTEGCTIEKDMDTVITKVRDRMVETLQEISVPVNVTKTTEGVGAAKAVNGENGQAKDVKKDS
ncbi:1-acylglycerol-3-phosphate O-acyltransferase [Quaeritorhiza haematococci]|nr:1-acylglycerol-3-phosphate O-acyltransferase [Quaeritorhiza haematococci]